MKHEVSAVSSARVLDRGAVLVLLVGLLAGLVGGKPALGSDLYFAERAITWAADGATSVFSADVDGDGDLDVLSASGQDDKIAWYESDGGSPPTFTEHVISTSADGARSVFATDLDGDGDTDVLSASLYDGKIAWYESDGGSPPAFTERVISVTGYGANCVLAADIDGDGDVDVLSASEFYGAVDWYENDGGSPPTFIKHVISNSYHGAKSVSTADMDGDGDIDIVSASGAYGAVYHEEIVWYENDGGSPPTFSEHVVSRSLYGASAVTAADMDGDGHTDLLSSRSGSGGFTWYKSDGGSPPVFVEQAVISSAAEVGSIVVVDMDGDGDNDVLVSAGNTITWHESRFDSAGPPIFTEHVISNAAYRATSAFAADMDGDGDVDVLAAAEGVDKIALYENTNPPSTFPEHIITTDAYLALSVYPADVDGDGDIDVVSPSWSDQNLAWYENDSGSPGSLTFTKRVIATIASPFIMVSAADMDGDGDADVLAASWLDGELAWYENSGRSWPTFTKHVISAISPWARSISAADLDGDGNLDVLCSSEAEDGRIVWYESDGGSPPTFSMRIIADPLGQPPAVLATDLDGDGDLDVVAALRDDNKIVWYQNRVRSSVMYFTEHLISDVDQPSSLFVADVDNDGDADVITSSSGAFGVISWYESDGASPPSFTTRIVSSTPNGPGNVFATDMDGDGDTDILAALSPDNKIVWYESDGESPPTFTERVIWFGVNSKSSLFAFDVDGDGDMDVLSASLADETIVWHENDLPRCGDGLIDPGEECDDGSESATCDADCTFVECGDSVINVAAGEECNGGVGCTNCLCDADYEQTSPPSLDCQTICGNGDLNDGEECDGGLGCNACACEVDFESTVPPSLKCQLVCGNGSLDSAEECDGGLRCIDCLCRVDSEPTIPPSVDCQLICGNGALDPGEECDGGLGCTACLCIGGFEPMVPASAHCQAICGNGACGLGEDSCNCPDDCGAPLTRETPGSTCGDGLDNDCDGAIDSDDADCADPTIPAVSQWGLITLCLLLLAGAKVGFGRKRATRTSA